MITNARMAEINSNRATMIFEIKQKIADLEAMNLNGSPADLVGPLIASGRWRRDELGRVLGVTSERIYQLFHLWKKRRAEAASPKPLL